VGRKRRFAALATEVQRADRRRTSASYTDQSSARSRGTAEHVCRLSADSTYAGVSAVSSDLRSASC
jgi:hypothetical protein